MLFLAAAAVCLSVGAGSAQAQRAGKQPHGKRAIEHHVERLEEQWRQAQLANDTATMEKLLADDFIGITADGLVNTKEQQVQRIRTRDLALTKIDIAEMKVKVAGPVAIVTSLVNVEGMSHGVPMSGFYRYTRVYQQQTNGAWKITNFEATRIPPAGPMRGGGRARNQQMPPGRDPVSAPTQ